MSDTPLKDQSYTELEIRRASLAREQQALEDKMIPVQTKLKEVIAEMDTRTERYVVDIIDPETL